MLLVSVGLCHSSYRECYVWVGGWVGAGDGSGGGNMLLQTVLLHCSGSHACCLGASMHMWGACCAREVGGLVSTCFCTIMLN